MKRGKRATNLGLTMRLENKYKNNNNQTAPCFIGVVINF